MVAHRTAPRSIPSPSPSAAPTAFPTYSAAAESKAKRQRLQQYKIRGLEALGVTAVCALLSLGAVAALTRLLPYRDALQDRLTEIDSQVVELQTSVAASKERLQTFLSTGDQVRIYNREGYILPGQKIVRVRDPLPTTKDKKDNPAAATSEGTESP